MSTSGDFFRLRFDCLLAAKRGLTFVWGRIGHLAKRKTQKYSLIFFSFDVSTSLQSAGHINTINKCDNYSRPIFKITKNFFSGRTSNGAKKQEKKDVTKIGKRGEGIATSIHVPFTCKTKNWMPRFVLVKKRFITHF